MISTPGTVDELLTPDDGDNWVDRMTAAEGGQVSDRIGQHVPKLGGLLTHAASVRAIAGRIPDLLRLDFGVILVGGWKKIEELQAYTNDKKYGPDETFLVELTKHVIVSSHAPKLEIQINEVKLDTLPFELKVTANIEGAVLTIRGGKIHSVSPGACKATLELKCEGYTLLKHEPPTLRLAPWTLKVPVAIPVPGVPEKP